MGNASVAEGVEVTKEPIANRLWVSEYEADQLRRKRAAEQRRVALWLMLLTFTAMLCIAAAAWVTQR